MSRGKCPIINAQDCTYASLDVRDIPCVVWVSRAHDNPLEDVGLIDIASARLEHVDHSVICKNMDTDESSDASCLVRVTVIHLRDPVFCHTIAIDSRYVDNRALISFVSSEASLKLAVVPGRVIGNRKCIILTHVETLPQHAQKAIRRTIDDHMANVLMVLVATRMSSIDPGLLSRSTVVTIPLSNNLTHNLLDGCVAKRGGGERGKMLRKNTLHLSKRALCRMSTTRPMNEIVTSVVLDVLDTAPVVMSSENIKDASVLLQVASHIEHICAHITLSNNKGTQSQQQHRQVYLEEYEEHDTHTNVVSDRLNIGRASAVTSAGMEMLLESARSVGASWRSTV